MSFLCLRFFLGFLSSHKAQHECLCSLSRFISFISHLFQWPVSFTLESQKYSCLGYFVVANPSACHFLSNTALFKYRSSQNPSQSVFLSSTCPAYFFRIALKPTLHYIQCFVFVYHKLHESTDFVSTVLLSETRPVHSIWMELNTFLWKELMNQLKMRYLLFLQRSNFLDFSSVSLVVVEDRCFTSKTMKRLRQDCFHLLLIKEI